LCVPFLLAATQAANGRDAVLFAPSLPPRALRRPSPGNQERGSAAGLSAAVANLSRLLATRLAHAAATLATGADRAACRDDARRACEVHDLITVDGR
jgi:hypothetical protein